MTRRPGRAWRLAVVLTLSGCGPRDDAGAATVAAGTTDTVEAPPPSTEPWAPSAVEEAERTRPTSGPRTPTLPSEATFRVVRVEGPAGDAPLAPGDTLALGHPLEAGRGRVVLDFTPGGRISLEPGGRLVRSASSATAVALGAGSATAALPPEGNSARPPLRVATPAGTVEIGGSGEAWVSVFPDGRVWAAALGGAFEVVTGAADAQGRLERVRVTAGLALVIGAGEPTAGPETLEAARAAALALGRGVRPVAASRRTARRAEHLARVEAAVRASDEEQARGRELVIRQRQAVRAQEPEAATLQRGLVAHGLASYRARRAVQVAFERAEALAVLDGGDAEWLAPASASVARSLPGVPLARSQSDALP